jgi:UDP-N-acetylmuramate dehydrogenase
LENALTELLGKEHIKFDESMKRHTTFKVGGNAEILVLPDDFSKIPAIINICKQFNKPFYLIGNGSNLIVKDSGYSGVIIKTSNLNKVKLENNKICAQCGVLLPLLAQNALNSELTGMEFLSGIPGTVGGAVCINAGAYGSEICSIVDTVKILDENGGIVTLKKEDILFSYRHSSLMDKPIILVEATFNLQKGNHEDIKARMELLKHKRLNTQPLNYPNAGSIFKKCGDYAAGYLIDQAGFKGFSMGGAEVSQKHANFIVNKGNATASDILELMSIIQTAVKAKFNLELKPEVIIL